MMNRFFICTLLISACSFSTLFAQQSISGNFNSGGQTRAYTGALPNNAQSALRLVILFCGINENAAQMELRGFNDYLSNNTMVIYPEPFNATAGFGNSSGVDDFQMVEDLIVELASTYTIDTADICIGGFSNGGIFTYNLICDFNASNSNRAYRFKSFAVVSGAMEDSTANTSDCPISGDIPHIAFHGTQDPVMNYNGAFLPPLNLVTESVDTTIAFWSQTINGCGMAPTVTTLPDLVTESPNSTVERQAYSNCSSTPNTVFYRVNGGFHSWPGGNAAIDMAQSRNMDVNASELIAAFFENSTTVSIVEVSSSPVQLSLYPNPVSTDLHITTDGSLLRVEVYSATGTKVLDLQTPSSPISLNALQSGLYFLRIETSTGTSSRKIIKK